MRRAWTPAEDAAIVRLYKGRRSWGRKIPRALAGRSPNAIHCRAGRIGAARPRAWTDEHDEVLRDAYARGLDLEGAARRLGRTRQSLVMRAKVLGLRYPHGSAWTPKEDATLRRLAEEGYGARALREALFPRTGPAIYMRLKALGYCGVRRGHARPTDLAREIGCSPAGLRALLHELGVASIGALGFTSLLHSRSTRHEDFDHDDARRALLLHKQALSVRRASALLGVDHRAVTRALGAAGLLDPSVGRGSRHRIDWAAGLVALGPLLEQIGATPEQVLAEALRRGWIGEEVHGLALEALPQRRESAGPVRVTEQRGALKRSA